MDEILEEKEQFAITDDSTAEWAIAKIKDAEADKEKFVTFYQAQIKKITEDAQSRIEYFTGLLSCYFQTVPRNVTKTGIEKYPLPSGELVQTPAKTDYERDNAVLLAWLQANKPDMIRTKTTTEPMWNELKKEIIATGELPDGVTPIEKPVEFKLKINS